MPGQLRAAAEHERLRPAAQLNRVVGDQAMAADDEVERALALADAALADDQHAEPEDVHQDAVNDAARGQIGVEDRATAGPWRRAWPRGSAAAAHARASASASSSGGGESRR